MIRGLQDARNPSSRSSTTSSPACDCNTATQPSCSHEISILYEGDEFRTYLEYHALNYQVIHPHITIQLIEVPSNVKSLVYTMDLTTTSSDDETWLRNQNAYAWDGCVLPAHLIGAMAESRRLADLSGYIAEDLASGKNALDWISVLPFQRYYQSTFDQQILTIPLDGDVLSLYYRRDLFRQHNVTVPRTWGEFQTAAAYFHNKPWGGPRADRPLVGSCVSRRPGCANAYWTSMILSSMTQVKGSSTGYLLDPSTTEPLLGAAMEETLRILGEQMRAGFAEEELKGNCLVVNFEAMNQGLCAMTYNWGNQLFVSDNDDNDSFEIGVAPTPGSTKVLNRASGQLETCLPETCPYGIDYEDIGIVNRPSYSAFGGWVAGVSNTTTPAKQRTVADFFAYASNPTQSLSDVLPNDISSFSDPYRYPHLSSFNWLNATRFFDETTASQYTEAIRDLNSENSVLEFRIPPGMLLRQILDEEVSKYLAMTQSDLESSERSDQSLRRDITKSMVTRMKEAVAAVETMDVTKVYQRSIGHTDGTTQVNMNYLDPDFRAAGWGLAGLICLGSFILVIWTVWNRKNCVMQAFQPFLLIQAAIGLFFLGATIIPLGFDDSLFSVDVLNYTCMITPWIYIVGLTLFYSSAYSKIRMCVKIFRDPVRYDVLEVQKGDALKILFRVFLLNGVCLALWTAVDPLKWKRQSVSGGNMLSNESMETFGACRGESFVSLGFACALLILNLILCLVGTIQSFRCRFLVLEFNEMQWLPLSLLPFFESWIIGGPILVFVNEDPTTTFILLTLVIIMSSVASALAVFAPIDWYIRKYQGGNRQRATSRSSPVGAVVLNHPTVESRTQVVRLQKQLEQVTAYNTELVFDIRSMKDRFHQMTEREKVAVAERAAMDGAARTVDSLGQRSVSDYEQTETAQRADESGLAAMEHFASVWSSHDDDDLVDDVSEQDDDEEAEVVIPVTAASMRSSLRSGTIGSIESENGEGLPREVSTRGIVSGTVTGVAALLGGFVYTRKSSRALTGEQSHDARKRENQEDIQHNKDEYNYGVDYDAPESVHSLESIPPTDPQLHATTMGGDSSRSFAEDSAGPGLFDDQIYGLEKTIESDDLATLELEAAILAERFKLNSTFLESVSDLQNIDEGKGNQESGLHYLDVSRITADTSIDVDTTLESMYGFPAGFVNRSMISTGNMNENSSVEDTAVAGNSLPVSRNVGTDEYGSMQNAAISLGYRMASTNPFEEVYNDNDDDDDDDQHYLKPPIPLQYQTPRKDARGRPDSDRMSSRSSSPQVRDYSPASSHSSHKKLPYSIADWSAVGMTGGILADLSDATSTSSYAGSYADSVSDIGDSTVRPSYGDLPRLVKEIDQMVAHSDFDGIRATTRSYDLYTSGPEEEDDDDSDGFAKIRERKEKKRELEAWRISLSRSFET